MNDYPNLLALLLKYDSGALFRLQKQELTMDQAVNGAIKYHSARADSQIRSTDAEYEVFSSAIASINPETLADLYRQALGTEHEPKEPLEERILYRRVVDLVFDPKEEQSFEERIENWNKYKETQGEDFTDEVVVTEVDQELGVISYFSENHPDALGRCPLKYWRDMTGSEPVIYGKYTFRLQGLPSDSFIKLIAIEEGYFTVEQLIEVGDRYHYIDEYSDSEEHANHEHFFNTAKVLVESKYCTGYNTNGQAEYDLPEPFGVMTSYDILARGWTIQE